MAITITPVKIEDDANTTVTLTTAGPWTISYDLAGVAAIGNVSGLSYQINENAAVGIDVPPALGVNTFQLPAADLPSNGSYLFTMIAFDDGNDSVSEPKTINLMIPAPPLPGIQDDDGG